MPGTNGKEMKYLFMLTSYVDLLPMKDIQIYESAGPSCERLGRAWPAPTASATAPRSSGGARASTWWLPGE